MPNQKMLLYVLTCVTTGKQYVGHTCRSFPKRWSAHVYTAKRGSSLKIAAAIRKHGQDAFIKEVVAEFDTREESSLAEQLFIAGLNTQLPRGYNVTEGGDGTHGYKRPDLSKRNHERIWTQEQRTAQANRPKRTGWKHDAESITKMRSKRASAKTRFLVSTSKIRYWDEWRIARNVAATFTYPKTLKEYKAGVRLRGIAC